MSLMLSDDEDLIRDHRVRKEDPAQPGSTAETALRNEASERTRLLAGSDDDDDDFFLKGPKMGSSLGDPTKGGGRLDGLQRQV